MNAQVGKRIRIKFVFRRLSKSTNSTARRATTFNVGGSSTLKEGRRGAKIADNF
jgi:hypothetical protein